MAWDKGIAEKIIADAPGLDALMSGADLKAKGKKRSGLAAGHSYLHLAVWALAPGAVDALLAAGADPNATDRSGLTPLLILAIQRKAKGTKRTAELVQRLCKSLVDGGGDTAASDEEGATALHLAAGKNDLVLLKALIEAGAPIDALSHDDPVECFMPRTALSDAAEGLHLKALKLLLSNDADPNLGETPPLVLTCRLGSDWGKPRTECAKVLIEGSSKDVCARAAFELYRNIPDEDAVLIQLLLAAGVDPNTTKNGVPLIVAMAGEPPSMQHGALVWKPMAAAEPVLAKADVNAADQGGWTTLHFAACQANVALVERLVELGANKSAALSADHTYANQSFRAGSTPADVAVARTIRSDWPDVQESLLRLLT